MNRENYVVFHTAADDSYMNSSGNFRGVDVTGNTTMVVYFAAVNNVASHDNVTINFTAGKEIEVMEAIAGAMAGSRKPFTVVADDINSIYCSDNITSCGAISVLGGNYKPVVTWSAATELFSYNSGATVITGDTSAGILTLPSPVDAGAGWFIDVFLAHAQGTAATHITTPAGFFIGKVTVDDLTGTAGESVIYVSDNDSNDFINLDTIAKGNGAGGEMRIISNGTNYLVSGSLVGDGTLNTTPFADAES